MGAAVACVLLWICAFLPQMVCFVSNGRVISFKALGWIRLVLQPILLFFWFKACYHWARAKGYSGIYALWGLANLIGAIVLNKIVDRTLPPELIAQQKEEEERRRWAGVDKF